MVRRRGGILLPVSFVLAGISGAIMALNLSLSSIAEMSDNSESSVGRIYCREQLNNGLIAMGMNWAGGPPYGMTGVWSGSWSWWSSYQARLIWEGGVSIDHFPGAIGQIRVEAKTPHGKLVVCYGAVTVNNNDGHAVSPTFLRNSLRYTP